MQLSNRATSTLAALHLLTGLSLAQTAVKDGHFLDPTVWDTGLVPGPGSAVVIPTGLTVGLYPQGMAAEPVRLASLRVEGSLVSSWPVGLGGQPILIECQDFYCPGGGAVLGEDSAFGPGGGVHIACDDIHLPRGLVLSAVEPGPYSFVNHGLIEAGAGLDGGDVMVDFQGGSFENCGTLKGGSGGRGGSVRVISTFAENLTKGKLEGGFGASHSGGSADLIAVTTPGVGPALLSNFPESSVIGGDSASGKGGSAGIAVYDSHGLGGTLVHEGIMPGGLTPAVVSGGAGASGGAVWVCAPTLMLKGTVLAGSDVIAPLSGPGPVTVSAIAGACLGDCSIKAGLLELRTSSLLDIGPLLLTPAIESSSLDLAAAPGSLVDLLDVTPGQWISASGSLSVAPGILTPPMPLSVLFGGPVSMGPAASKPESRLTLGATAIGYADETVPGKFAARLDPHLGHFGNGPALLSIDILPKPALSLPATAILPATAFPVGKQVRLPFNFPILPVGPTAPLITVTWSSAGIPMESFDLPLWLLSKKPSVELFGEAPGRLWFQPRPAASPPLTPVTGLLRASPGGPSVIGFLAIDAVHIDPPLPLIGLTLWVSPFAAPLIAMLPSPGVGLPVTLTSGTLAGLDFFCQAALYDLAAPGGPSLMETNAMRLNFRP